MAASFPNSGLETMPQGGANDWTWSTSGWTWDASIAHSGSHSARVSRGGGDITGNLLSAMVAVQPSMNFTLSYWLRMDSVTMYPRVMVYQYTNSGVQVGLPLAAYANIGNGTKDWNVVHYRFQTLPNTAQIRIRIYIYSDTIGTFWFDDFSLNQDGAARFPLQANFPIASSGDDWLSSPIVADINHDGKNELLIGAGSAVNGWNNQGVKLPSFPLQTGDRSIVGQVAVADLNHDGRMEIVAGTRSTTTEGQCRVFVWGSNGSVMKGWPQSVDWDTQYSNDSCWITSVVLADIDGDNNLEILASTTNNGSANIGAKIATPNLYAWHLDGSLVIGNWPNYQTTAGIYGALAAGDVLKNGKSEVVVARDYLYLNMYGANGQSLSGWPIQTYVNGNGGNYDKDQRIEYRVNAPILADLNGDGKMETIVAGHVAGPGNTSVDSNNALMVFKADGTRFPGWETAAVGSGILWQSDRPWQAPVVADLNGDGKLEIVVESEDGWIRAYKADKTLLWAFNYTQGSTLFASEPVIGDIDGDGAPEIVFGTYVPLMNATDKDGPVGLWALKANGTVVPGFPLVVPTSGIRSAPTLADLNGDGKLDIVAATRSGQVFVWSTSAPYNPALLPWPTGRHDLRRSAAYVSLSSNLSASSMAAYPSSIQPGQTSTFILHIASDTPVADELSLTNVIPDGLSYLPDTLTASSGAVTETGGVIQWNGILTGNLAVDIQYQVTFTPNVLQSAHLDGLSINNMFTLETPSNEQIQRSGLLSLGQGFSYFLPITKK